MTIGAALLLIAAGAILRFAIATVTTHGVDLHTIGDILMVVGVLGLLLWLFVWAPWVRSRRNGYAQHPPLEDHPLGAYRGERYPQPPADKGERYPYPPGEQAEGERSQKIYGR